MILPDSGALGVAGAEIRRGIDLLPKDLRAGLGVHLCDDESRIDRALNCAKRLVDQDKVSAIVGPLIENGDTRNWIAGRKVLQMSLAGQGPRFDPPPTYFKARENSGELATYAADFISRTLKPRKLTVIAPKNALAAGRSWRDVFPDVDSRHLPANMAELQKVVEVAAKDDSDVVYIMQNAPAEHLMALARRLEGKRVVIATALRSYTERPNPPNVIVFALGPPPGEEGVRFERAYREKYGVPPATYIAHNTYAAFQILAEVFLNKGAGSPEQAADLMRKAVFQTVLGRLRFGERSSEAITAVPAVAVEFKAGLASGKVLVQSTGGTQCNCALDTCCSSKSCCNPKECKGKCTSRLVAGSGLVVAANVDASEVCDERQER